MFLFSTKFAMIINSVIFINRCCMKWCWNVLSTIDYGYKYRQFSPSCSFCDNSESRFSIHLLSSALDEVKSTLTTVLSSRCILGAFSTVCLIKSEHGRTLQYVQSLGFGIVAVYSGCHFKVTSWIICWFFKGSGYWYFLEKGS